jgi:hypothetical protein
MSRSFSRNKFLPCTSNTLLLGSVDFDTEISVRQAAREQSIGTDTSAAYIVYITVFYVTLKHSSTRIAFMFKFQWSRYSFDGSFKIHSISKEPPFS